MIRLATERDFQRYKRAAKALHLPIMETWLELEVRDRAGQLAYSVTDAPAITWTGGTLTFKVDWVRYFNNNSGAPITVWEVGLVCEGGYTGGTGTQLWMNARDVLGASVSVPNGGQLKVTYSISLVYPA